MAFTRDQLNALDAALADGVLEYRHNGRQVRYHSKDEMLKVRATMVSELNAASRMGRPMGALADFSRGLE
jgi:roadblock/LC7 domain-containing protein